MAGYGHATPTPNSGASSVSTTPFENNGFVQLAQNMQQMSLGPAPPGGPRGFVPVGKYPQSFDPRRGSMPKPQLNFSKRPVLMGSSQSSTGTSSPATTVVASAYCPAVAPAPANGQFRTPPPSTPPAPHYVFNSMPPRFFRQMSGDRGPTPGTAKSSRSPTPAIELSPFERQRFTYPPPNVCHGFSMPYLVQADPRLVGRGQPAVYRHATPPMPQTRQPMSVQGHDNRSHTSKNRRPK
ncbi:hypothetical protein HUJ05_007222 [Dendroctonus ponderosae]|nr:hypothetical protein HUJ05_007222 [Dendroctonus ponderosae]